jgi:hypothetical protein
VKPGEDKAKAESKYRELNNAYETLKLIFIYFDFILKIQPNTNQLITGKK